MPATMVKMVTAVRGELQLMLLRGVEDVRTDVETRDMVPDAHQRPELRLDRSSAPGAEAWLVHGAASGASLAGLVNVHDRRWY